MANWRNSGAEVSDVFLSDVVVYAGFAISHR